MDGVTLIMAMVMGMATLITVMGIIIHIITITTHIIMYRIIGEEETLIIIEQVPAEEPTMFLPVIPTVVPNYLDV
tara:strand:- start:250 stop:474 length:225 start_codon:yes stop_codon:yes gene_type:complete